jgi:hypothetical protein
MLEMKNKNRRRPMFINDYPLSLYDEDTIFTVDDPESAQMDVIDYKQKKMDFFKRYLRLVLSI